MLPRFTVLVWLWAFTWSADFEKYTEAVRYLDAQKKRRVLGFKVTRVLLVANVISWTPRKLVKRHALSRVYDALREQERAETKRYGKVGSKLVARLTYPCCEQPYGEVHASDCTRESEA